MFVKHCQRSNLEKTMDKPWCPFQIKKEIRFWYFLRVWDLLRFLDLFIYFFEILDFFYDFLWFLFKFFWDFWIFLDLRDFLWFLWIFFKVTKIPTKSYEVTTEHQKLPKISTNSLKSSFCLLEGQKKTWPKPSTVARSKPP